MRFNPTRFAILALGDRLVAAVIQRRRVETFVVDAETPAAALRAELDQRRLGVRAVWIGLPRSAVTVKPIDLPAVAGEADDMVRFELERHLPYGGGEDTPFDFVPLASDGDGGAQRVLIAAADRRLVESTLRVAEDAKLRPVSLTVAAHNLLALVARPRRGHVVWVHRTGTGADLLFIDAGALVLSRSVADADDDLVAEEIRRSFTVARWRECDAIWVSGDRETETAGPLHALGAPVGEPPYTAAARRLLAGVSPDGSPGLAELAVAVAAGPRTRPLELLPRALRPRRLTRTQLVTAGLAALCVILGIVALLVPGWREGRRLAAVNARIAALDPEVRAVEKVMQDLERKRRMLGTVQSIESASVRPLPVLRELTDLLPSDAWLTMLSLDGKGIELTGQAGAASALIPLLENSSHLERVEFSSPVTRGRDREQFRIRAAWEGGAGSVALAPASPGRSMPGAPGAQPRATPGAITSGPPPPVAPGVTPPTAPVPPAALTPAPAPPALAPAPTIGVAPTPPVPEGPRPPAGVQPVPSPTLPDGTPAVQPPRSVPLPPGAPR
ncbi:MAG TPA: PilN domain-containing protein [Methylomirabilota bacterium]|nr:PilN domain-containing protein [Methylomirabilota bacterium]